MFGIKIINKINNLSKVIPFGKHTQDENHKIVDFYKSHSQYDVELVILEEIEND